MVVRKLGVIGCGTIASAVVTGLCQHDPTHHFDITVSPRNASKAAALKKAFPEQITIAKSNQQVVDTTDWILLAVTPQQAEHVIASLTFDAERHHLLTLVAIVSSEQLSSWTQVPVDRIFRAVPLPPVAKQRGVTVILPPNDQIKELFDLVGKAVCVKSQQELLALQAVTCLMGPYYEKLKVVRDWAVAQGVEPVAASTYTAGMFASIAADAVDASASETGFDELVAEQTPGGLNEGAIAMLHEQHVYSAYTSSLDATLARLNGK